MTEVIQYIGITNRRKFVKFGLMLWCQ